MQEQELKDVHKQVAKREAIENFMKSLTPFLMFLTKKI